MNSHRIRYIFLLCLCKSFLASSQYYTDDFWILESVISGTKIYEAYDSITMKNGFSYSSSGGNAFEARVIPANTLISDLNYIQKPEIERELNTSLPVGSLPGSNNVSATGALNYTIPIEVPPGRNKLTPEISITYNSNAGIKLLGRGWDIAGISCISRVNKNIYHDGQAGSINLNQDDKFALDGNRLIAVNGLYGANGTEYRTEFENFSRIISHGIIGSSPTYFSIETKEGLTLEYGNTRNSRIEASGQADVLFWYLNKIIDNYGNYIEYKYYENNSTGEVRPVEINYSGNQALGFAPNNSIRFTYEQKTDKNVYYVAGSQIKDDVLLKKIEVLHENSRVRDYEFNYSWNNESQLFSLYQ